MWKRGEENNSFSTLTSKKSIGNINLDSWIEHLLCNVQIGVKDEFIILDLKINNNYKCGRI